MKRFLFFFVHPAKFHAFRHAINDLRDRGHTVDVLIVSKDMLEQLIQREGWTYTNLFPKGRRAPYLHTYLSAALFSVLTIFKLLRYVAGRKYTVFVTDDLLTVVGRLKRVPTIFFTDDDLSAVPESSLLAWTATDVVCPSVCSMKSLEHKKVGYHGLKAMAHLHPKRFKPDRTKLLEPFQREPFFFVRCVSATSTHDVGKTGLTDDILRSIIATLKPHGRVLISSQRSLPSDLSQYRVQIDSSDVAHYLALSEIVVSDSTTMCAEAAVLGVPAIEIDDWYADFRQYHELHDRYQLLFGFFPRNSQQAVTKLQELLDLPDRRTIFDARRRQLIQDSVDVSGFLSWLFENYPASVTQVKTATQGTMDQFR